MLYDNSDFVDIMYYESEPYEWEIPVFTNPSLHAETDLKFVNIFSSQKVRSEFTKILSLAHEEVKTILATSRKKKTECNQ